MKVEDLVPGNTYWVTDKRKSTRDRPWRQATFERMAAVNSHRPRVRVTLAVMTAPTNGPDVRDPATVFETEADARQGYITEMLAAITKQEAVVKRARERQRTLQNLLDAALDTEVPDGDR